MKVFARCTTINDKHAGRIPYNRNIAIAVEGFHEMGFEIYFYNTVNEIYDIYELGDIVLDGIAQVEYCLNKFNIKFPNIDYPDILKPYLGRKIWKDTINNISNNKELWGNFVKPVKEKIFTGHIINSTKDLIGCSSSHEDYEVLVSEPLDILFEVRGLVYYDKLIDLRPYSGSWEYMKYIDTELINKAMKDWKQWDDRPMGCTLDWGIVAKQELVASSFQSMYKSYYNNKDNCYNKYQTVYKTVLIEANTGISFGPYSTNAIDYAKIISAAMSKASGTIDECYFGNI